MKPLEKIYYWGDKIHKWRVKPNVLEHCVVISVGNITTGGTGKTPGIIYLANLLRSEGHRIGVLSRGYGGTRMRDGGLLSDGSRIYMTATESGDEPYLIAANLPGVVTGIGKRRFSTGKLLTEKYGVNLMLLDDGFQHYQLDRDVDIVLIDATNPFGNGHLLPNGILREPVEALKRSDIIIVTKSDLISPGSLETLKNSLAEISGHQHIFHAVHKPEGLYHLPDQYYPGVYQELKKKKTLEIKGESVWALSGIGNHRSFEMTLRNLGAAEVQSISFKDHHKFSEKDIDSICRRVSPYDFIVTTEKDFVRLIPYREKLKSFRNLYFLKIQLRVDANEILLKEGIRARILARS